eukprot:1765052-Rhodomonas_salina.1
MLAGRSCERKPKSDRMTSKAMVPLRGTAFETLKSTDWKKVGRVAPFCASTTVGSDETQPPASEPSGCRNSVRSWNGAAVISKAATVPLSMM